MSLWVLLLVKYHKKQPKNKTSIKQGLKHTWVPWTIFKTPSGKPASNANSASITEAPGKAPKRKHRPSDYDCWDYLEIINQGSWQRNREFIIEGPTKMCYCIMSHARTGEWMIVWFPPKVWILQHVTYNITRGSMEEANGCQKIFKFFVAC